MAAIKSLNAFFKIPATEHDQDWEVQFADASKIQEFIDSYRDNKWDEDERFGLMSLIIASYDEFILENGHHPDIWSQISTLLLREKDLHKSTLDYWAQLEGGDNPDHYFYISPYIREVLAEIEATDK